MRALAVVWFATTVLPTWKNGSKASIRYSQINLFLLCISLGFQRKETSGVLEMLLSSLRASTNLPLRVVKQPIFARVYPCRYLSYHGNNTPRKKKKKKSFASNWKNEVDFGFGKGRIRTYVENFQQIYSLSLLTTRPLSPWWVSFYFPGFFQRTPVIYW